MKPADLSARIGVAASTIRAWTSGEYKRYLTPSAQGGDGAHRNITDLDAQIIWLIATLKNAGSKPDEIHLDLQRLQADDWNDLPPLPETVGSKPMPVVASAALDEQRRALLREIALQQQRVEKLESALTSERDAHFDTQRSLLEEIARLRERIGGLDAELRLYREGRLKSDKP
mgnify:FL=1